MIICENMEQGSDAWYAIRRGRPTGSQFSRIITPAQGKFSAQAEAYAIELVAESFCPEWIDFAGNKHTDRGTEMEPLARKAFEEDTGLKVEQVGFIIRDATNPLYPDGLAGCSPDGLIRGPDGEYIAGLELKAPSPKVHAGYVWDGKLPDVYKAQVHGGMAVTGLSTWHFYSWYPGLKPLHVIVHRDEFTEKLAAALDEFVILYARIRAEAIPKLQVVPKSDAPETETT